LALLPVQDTVARRIFSTGKGIQESILDLRGTIPIHFVIADGIGPMEGNGPLNGPPRALGKIVLADDPVGANATCARPRTSATRAFLVNLNAR
jgi:uncharacterized protein (DUF362 family)